MNFIDLKILLLTLYISVAGVKICLMVRKDDLTWKERGIQTIKAILWFVPAIGAITWFYLCWLWYELKNMWK